MAELSIYGQTGKTINCTGWEGAAQSMQDFTKSYIDMHRKINCQSSSLELVISIFMRIQVSPNRLTEDALKFYGIFNECVVLVWTSQMFVEIKWCHLKFSLKPFSIKSHLMAYGQDIWHRISCGGPEWGGGEYRWGQEPLNCRINSENRLDSSTVKFRQYVIHTSVSR